MTSTFIDRLTGLNASAAVKVPTVAATVAPITLSDLQTIDGVVLAANDRVLVKDQADTRANGIYLVSTGIWNRAPDFDDNRDVMNGTVVYVAGGTGTGFYAVTATNPVVLGTSTLTFVVPSYTAILAAVTAAGFARLASPVFTGNPTTPTASPGDSDTSVANTAFVASAISTAILAQVPTANITLNVPSIYATIDLALAAADILLVLDAVTVTINIAAGTITRATTLAINKSYGDRLSIVGATTTTTAITAIASVTGSTGAYSAVLSVANTTGVNVGDIVGVEAVVGVATAAIHRGAWKVASFVANTSVTVTNTARNTAPPTGVTGTLRIYPTQIKFNGVDGINGGSITLTNLAIQGDATASKMGVWATPIGNRPGKIIATQVVVNGFGAEGFRANYNGVLYATTCYSSNNGNNGFMARDGGTLYGASCIASGNGVLAPAGGGNGYLSENNSAMFLTSPGSFGNVGDGLWARTSASILVDTSFPAFAVGNVNGFHASFSGFFQSVSGIATNCTTNGAFAEKQGHIIATSGGFTSCAVGMLANSMGFIDAQAATITTMSSFGVSSQGQSRIECNSSALASISGATAFRADDMSWITMTSSTGTTTVSPTVNTLGNNNAYIKS